jgi:GTP cyclohydrolase I
MYTEEIFYGLDYNNFPVCSQFNNHMQYDEMISVSAQIKSVCEHHFLPFLGTAYCAYIPESKVIGLSKICRVADFFARRPQVQERLTAQIHASLQLILSTESVAVVIQATHDCVKLRGIQDPESTTTTSKLGGKFMSNPALRQEFLALTRTSQ